MNHIIFSATVDFHFHIFFFIKDGTRTRYRYETRLMHMVRITFSRIIRIGDRHLVIETESFCIVRMEFLLMFFGAGAFQLLCYRTQRSFIVVSPVMKDNM